MSEMHNENINIESLLVKYLNNEATEMEVSEVNSWRSLSEENESYFQELQLIWLDTGIVSDNKEVESLTVDTDKAWSKLSARIDEENVFKTSGFKLNISFLTKVAAVLILVIGGIWFFNFVSQETAINQELIATNNTINKKLSDSSLIVLNKNAKLIYPSEFTGDERRVKLKGEAYFNITPNKEKPFIIEVDESIVKVLGTSFVVRESIIDSTISVFVETGKVMFSYNHQEVVLTKGMSATFNKKTKAINKEKTPLINLGAWESKKLTFKQTSLKEVVKVLNEVYNKNVTLQNESMNNCSLTVTFNNESFEDVMEIIQATFNYELEEVAGAIIIKGDGC